MKRLTKKELKSLAKIATETFVTLEGRGDLEKRMNDEEDYYDVSVSEIEVALAKAYELGKQSK